jgi:hypothetical protein
MHILKIATTTTKRNGWEQKSIKTLHCSEIEAKITVLKTNDFCQMTSYVTDIRKRTRASVAAINEQKQVKSIDWKIGKLMILIDFVHDFNFFYFYSCLPSSSYYLFCLWDKKEQDTLRVEEKCQSQQEKKLFFLLYKNLLCLSFFVNSTQIVPHKYLLIHALFLLLFSILILFTNFSRIFCGLDLLSSVQFGELFEYSH